MKYQEKKVRPIKMDLESKCIKFYVQVRDSEPNYYETIPFETNDEMLEAMHVWKQQDWRQFLKTNDYCPLTTLL